MKTRNEVRRDRIMTAVWLLLLFVTSLVFLCTVVKIVQEITENSKPLDRESKVVYSEVSFPVVISPPPKIVLSPDTSNPPALEYDYDYVCRVVMAETGGEYNEDLTLAVCQAIMNAATENGWTPEEVCINYQYTSPHSYTSDFIQEICDRVFLCGEVYEDSGNAQVFYNPSYGYSSYHENQIFVCEIGGVRFFEKVAV